VTDNSNNWRPTASIETLRKRAQLLERTRAFFVKRGLLEVETPAISHSATTELHLSSWLVRSPNDDGQTCYLHTSPELAMKRLLAAGSGDIYQLCKVFREAEQGSRHNPEFTLLECYRLGFDMDSMMQEVETFLMELLPGRLTHSAEYISWQQAFIRYAGCDPFEATANELQEVFASYTGQRIDGMNIEDWYDLLMSQVIEPALPSDRLVFVTHYPASRASLARLDTNDSRLAQRFEVFAGGLELANGFHELSDAREQRRRIERENQQRSQAGLPEVDVDEYFLAALEHGLPDCSGVAVGFDRLVMLATGEEDIAKVLSFSFANA
jgi:lysyl-tRNA synthetase class 2